MPPPQVPHAPTRSGTSHRTRRSRLPFLDAHSGPVGSSSRPPRKLLSVAMTPFDTIRRTVASEVDALHSCVNWQERECSNKFLFTGSVNARPSMKETAAGRPSGVERRFATTTTIPSRRTPRAAAARPKRDRSCPSPSIAADTAAL